MLLSRLANNLFWFGRYLERTEHTMRFVSIQYYSTFDTPDPIYKKIVYNSIIHMYGIGNSPAKADDLETLLKTILLDPENGNSILSSLREARTNTMNLRNIISVELWETVNRFSMFLSESSQAARLNGFDFEFTRQVLDYCSLIRNLVNSTLMHDETWAIIRFGIYLERAIQINRILLSQITGISKLDGKKGMEKVRFHLLITLLKSLQAKDMYYKTDRESLSVESVSEFLVTQRHFPRAISYNLHKSQQIYNRWFDEDKEDMAGYELNRMSDTFKYLRSEDMEGKLQDFLHDCQHRIEHIAYLLEKNHLQI